ncbi:LysM peptidoglycan-binding domain-containing protein [Aspergillus undulatus]|uniref:LysM peptidoglycan-binding domain-containing protein n=1 Tax=Aspergillus undulatus TaxID=1810928 RepID=UPI003CCCDA2B
MSTSATTTTTAPTSPAETRPGAVSSATRRRVVVDGDGCAAIAEQYGISPADFLKWNPGVEDDCSPLWLGYAVCVEL